MEFSESNKFIEDSKLEGQTKDTDKTKNSKSTKKAATKTAVANFLKTKEFIDAMRQDKEATGNAISDGSRGFVKVLTTIVDPRTYIKRWVAQLAAIIAPYILLFMTLGMLVVVVVALFSSLMNPLSQIMN